MQQTEKFLIMQSIFRLFVTIFGLNKRYLEKNEYLCNLKTIIYANG